MNTTDDKKMNAILEKLRKLQNLYDGALKINSEAEAANAAAKIQRILLQYNLTLDQIPMEGKEKRDEFIRESASGFTYKNIGGYWEYDLMKTLCKHNLCRCFMNGDSYKYLVLFGSKENLEVVKWLRGMLSEKYVKLSLKRYKEYTAEFQGFKPMGVDTFRRRYLLGCCRGLDEKLTAEEQSLVECQALIVLNDKKLDKYIHESVGVIGTISRPSLSGGRSAYDQGCVDGRNTEIYKPIEQNKSKGEIQ